MALTVRDIVNKSAAYLAAAGLESSRLEAELLVGHALDLDRTQLYVQFDRPVTEDERRTLRALLLARARERQPVAYLTGHRLFLGLDLLVPRGVFIPRPETEELVEAVAGRLAGPWRIHEERPMHLLDLCTGTGAIALTLAHRFPQAQVVAVDLAPQAVEAAAANASRLGLSDRVSVRAGDLWAALDLADSFDVVVANPPYIPRAALAALPVEVAGHEPRLALDGGPDGLEVHRRIMAGLERHLRPGGLLALEHGPEQAGQLAVLAQQAGLAGVEDRPDLAGRPRVLLAQRPGAPPAV